MASMLPLLASIALAAPTFRAESPALAALASRAWRHATACAGQEALAAEEVWIEIGSVPGGFAGHAVIEGPGRAVSRDRAGNVVKLEDRPGRGLYGILLGSDAPSPLTVAHEVAHAWAYGGAPALTEGAASLLGACISERDPAHFPPEKPRTDSLVGLVELRLWENFDGDTASRQAGYTASERMFALLAEVVPRERLWRAYWTWAEFDVVLGEAGTVGSELRSALAGGVDAQRAMLADLDGDGILGLRERLAGTDPTRWDSDGDGWWDGAPDELRARAVRLPAGAPVCSGWAAGPLGATVSVRGGTSTKEGQVPIVLIDGAQAKDQSAPVRVPARGSIALARNHSGDGWGLVSGNGLVKDERCWSNESWTVFVSPGHEAALAPFTAALGLADARVTADLGRATSRRFVRLGEPFPPVSSVRATRVPDGWLARAAAGEWDYVAAYVVAKERLPESALLEVVPGDTALFEAYARTLVPRPPEVLLTALEEGEVEDWTDRAAACQGGWPALLRETCGRPSAIGERKAPPAGADPDVSP
jgi:hypothetical protein